MRNQNRTQKKLSALLKLELWQVQGSKPWLDKNGKRLPTAYLKLIAASWDKKTWNQYLNSFNRKEESALLGPETWTRVLEKATDSVWEFSQATSDQEITREIYSSFKALPEMHRTVLQMTYWHGMSLREIGKALNISKSLVHNALKDAERTLRALIKPRNGQFHSSKDSELPTKEQDNDQNISA